MRSCGRSPGAVGRSSPQSHGDQAADRAAGAALVEVAEQHSSSRRTERYCDRLGLRLAKLSGQIEVGDEDSLAAGARGQEDARLLAR